MEHLVRMRRGDENLISLRKKKLKQIIYPQPSLQAKFKEFGNWIVDLSKMTSIQQKLSILKQMTYLVDCSTKISEYVRENYLKDIIEIINSASDSYLISHMLFLVSRLRNLKENSGLAVIIEQIHNVTDFIQKNVDSVEASFILETCNLFKTIKYYSKLNIWMKLEVFNVLIFSRQIKEGFLLLGLLSDSKPTAKHITDEFILQFLEFGTKLSDNFEDYLICLDKVVTNDFISVKRMTIKAVVEHIDLTNFRFSAYLQIKIRIVENLILIAPKDMFFWLRETNFLSLLCDGALHAEISISRDSIFALLRLFLADDDEVSGFLASHYMKQVFMKIEEYNDKEMIICLLEGLNKLKSQNFSLKYEFSDNWFNVFLENQIKQEDETISNLSTEIFNWLYCQTIED